MIRKLQILLILFAAPYFVYAGSPKKIDLAFHPRELLFVENRGQLKHCDPGCNTAKDVKYYSHNGEVNFFCRPGKISFIFSKKEKATGTISEATGRAIMPGKDMNPNIYPNMVQAFNVTVSRLDMILEGGNLNATIVADDQQDYFENFFTNGNADKGILKVPTYKTVIYKEIYNHIDLLLFARENALKYEFVVHPGGTVSDIQLRWNGTKKTGLRPDGGMVYSCSLGELKEEKPCSYLADGHNITSAFINVKHLVGFKIGQYDHKQDLIIDPNLTWASYFGGPQDEYEQSSFLTSLAGNAVSADKNGNIVSTGTTASISAIASKGAYQTSFGGTTDAYVTKFSPTGSRLWSTYFGGLLSDCAFAVSVDKSDNIFITGTTNSDSSIATNGSYQSVFNADDDAFVAKFNANGNLLWSTYLGGNSIDMGFGIANDLAGNVYITGSSFSNVAMASNGAYQTALAGACDIFIAKFTSTGALAWSTYFGGTSFDLGYGICVDAAGNVLITGNTWSKNGIATPGAYQGNMAGLGYNPGVFGGGDAFISKFSAAGNLIWSTYLGGFFKDIGYGITTDAANNIYVTGETYSDSMGTPGTFQIYNKANDIYTHSGMTYNNAFITKFTSGGVMDWFTYFGASLGTLGRSIAVSNSGKIYITGYTFCEDGIASFDAYQKVFGGVEDAFIAIFTNSGQLDWSTYYGGLNYDIGYGLCLDPFGNMIICGITNSTSGIASQGIFQSAKGGGYDAYIAKFKLEFSNDAGIISIGTPKGSFCTSTWPVSVKLKNLGTTELDSVSVGWSINGNFKTPYQWKGKLKPGATDSFTIGNALFPAGFGDIKTWTYAPNGLIDSVPQNDTSNILDTVITGPTPNVGAYRTICKGQSTTIGDKPLNGFLYSWTSLPYGFTSTISNPVVAPDETTTYFLKILIPASQCTGSASVTITVLPLPNPKWTLNFLGKTGYFQTVDISFDDTSCHWSFGDGDSATGHLATHNYKWIGSYKVWLKVTNAKGCTNEFDSIINVTTTGVNGIFDNQVGLNFYPNPFQNRGIISYNLAQHSSVSISLYDITGRAVFTMPNVKQEAGDYSFEISGEKQHLNAGIYLLKLNIDDRYLSLPIVFSGN